MCWQKQTKRGKDYITNRNTFNTNTHNTLILATANTNKANNLTTKKIILILSNKKQIIMTTLIKAIKIKTAA